MPKEPNIDDQAEQKGSPGVAQPETTETKNPPEPDSTPAPPDPDAKENAHLFKRTAQ